MVPAKCAVTACPNVQYAAKLWINVYSFIKTKGGEQNITQKIGKKIIK